MTAPKFGTTFTDHLVRATWREADGWSPLRVEPYGPLELDPATAVLHYGQEVFEGLKAFAHPDGTVWAFRPERNAQRMQCSARRLALPEVSEADFLSACEQLVQADRKFVPTDPDASLYLRPVEFGVERFLGVRPAKEVAFLVIASPSGSYFGTGTAGQAQLTPVSIWVDNTYHRAGPGGTGAAKCGGNYAASLLPQAEAAARGFDQVCFLDAVTNSALEELGGMNAFIVMADGSVHTPALTGSILEGITRDSIIQLLDDWGIPVHQRRIELAELTEGLAQGAVAEVFACGTAAVITPIGRLAGEGFDFQLAAPGPLTAKLREELTGIQYGRIPDRHGWLRQMA